ncbi:MAG TPA: polysaccharide deacetylase family protein [Natronosporangium sp.]
MIATAVAVVATSYGIGNVLARATFRESPGGEPESSNQTAASSGTDESVTGANADAALAAPAEPAAGPVGPPLSEVRPGGPYGSHETTGADYVALTFDDGPDPRWTPDVLELLRKHEVKATFCVVGEMAEAFPELIQAIAADGHTLCNHSWNHDLELGGRSRDAIRADLTRTNAAIRAAVPGARISYYRQPGGAWTERVVEVAEELGMESLHWTVDPQDWTQPAATVIAAILSAGTEEGGIVLLHDGGGERQNTVRALRSVLPELTARHKLAALPATGGHPAGFR